MTKQAVAAANPQDWSHYGYDMSWPQCNRDGSTGLPRSRGGLAIVGITGGRPLSINPCMKAQWVWALKHEHHSGYINVASPKDGSDAFAYGQRTVRRAIGAAAEHGVRPAGVWLDVENGNYWSSSTVANYQVVLGALQELKDLHIQSGVYTTPNNWSHITGNRKIPVPFWLAVAFQEDMASGCNHGGIGSRLPDMVQAVLYEDGHFIDWNMICTSSRKAIKSDLMRAIG